MIVDPSLVLTISYILVAGGMIAYVLHLIWGQMTAGRLGTGLSVAALASLTVGLTLRTMEAGHWPLSNSYEFSLAFLWSTLVVYLILERLMATRATGAFVMPVALLIATYAQLLTPEWTRLPRPLLPALRTVWLQLHVTTGAVAYGAFAVSCGVAVMYLVGEAVNQLPATFPPASTLDDFNFRALSIGYPWISLVLITGAVWAQVAWGRYWSWDAKETWTLATWLLYTVVLHLRALRRWRGRPVAFLSILGFVFVLFTFLGVGWLARQVGLQSLHLY
jgi:cytochrome c-type biogenesis protein CcsB